MAGSCKTLHCTQEVDIPASGTLCFLVIAHCTDLHSLSLLLSHTECHNHASAGMCKLLPSHIARVEVTEAGKSDRVRKSLPSLRIFQRAPK